MWVKEPKYSNDQRFILHQYMSTFPHCKALVSDMDNGYTQILLHEFKDCPSLQVPTAGCPDSFWWASWGVHKLRCTNLTELACIVLVVADSLFSLSRTEHLGRAIHRITGTRPPAPPLPPSSSFFLSLLELDAHNHVDDYSSILFPIDCEWFLWALSATIPS